MTAERAIEKLKAGNAAYLTAERGCGDISPTVRQKTFAEGQSPYAIIVTCADSRVIPESIFSAGIGELFVIRAAGNVVDNAVLGSIEYAAEHLGCKLVLVLGHSRGGAVNAAIGGGANGFVKFITDEIAMAIGDEKDDLRACRLNVKRSAERIRKAISVDGLQVAEALYRIDSGKVEF